MKLPAACRGARAFVNVTRPAGSIRSYSSSSSSKRVRIVEVSPRDGLQNESLPLTADTKAELISRLSRHGFRTIEAGSFVTGRVKQMANSRKVLLHPSVLDCLHRPDNTDSDQGRGSSILQFLVPSEKYLGRFLDAADLALATVGHKASAYREALEVSVFVAATEGFSKANLNATRAEAMERTSKVTRAALDKGFRVRGYISCVAGCPFEGSVPPADVQEVASDLRSMGCYEISLADTTGVGTPSTMEQVLNEVVREVPLEMLAAHCHDTYGSAVANVLHMVKLGVRTVDSSIAGLGGCPFAPGASGNVATEDVVYALELEGYPTDADLGAWDGMHDLKRAMLPMAETGRWIADKLGKVNGSRAGRAILTSCLSK